MRKVGVSLTIIVLIFWASVSHATVQLEILEPTTISTTANETVKEDINFSSDFGGPAQIQIVFSKLSRVTVALNGKIIFERSEFGNQEDPLVKDIFLNVGDNNLRIEMRGKKGGNELTTWIIQDVFDVRVVPPDQVEITAVDKTYQLKVLGELSDDTGVDITGSVYGSTYNSSNFSIAEISSEGLITATGKGDTSVEVANDSFSASIPVSVLGYSPSISNLSINPESPLPVTTESNQYTIELAFNYMDPDADIRQLQVTHTFPDGQPQITTRNFIPEATGRTLVDQLEIDSSFPAGEHQISVEITDELGNSSGIHSLSFSLSAEVPPVLAITGISPASGKPGDTVLISGEGFSEVPSEQNVYFEGCIDGAEIVSSTLTQLEVIVPDRALTGPVMVKNNVAQAESETPFDVDQTIRISPTDSPIITGKTIQFSCDVSGVLPSDIIWAINGQTDPNPGLGSIDEYGLYASPANIPDPNTIIVSCASADAPELVAEATVEIIAPEPEPGQEIIKADIGGQIESAKGAVKVIIPPGALAQDTQITVEVLNPDDFPSPSDELRNLSAVKLGPDQSFNEPVTVVFPLKNWEKPGKTLKLYFMDESTSDLVDSGKTAVVDETGVYATGEIDHFSNWFAAGELEELELVAPPSIDEVDPTCIWLIGPQLGSVPFLEGLSVPIMVTQLCPFGIPEVGPFSRDIIVTPVLEGYTAANTPLSAGPIVQPSANGMELGTVINIPVLPDCGAGETRQATLVIGYRSSSDTIEIPFEIECLCELNFGQGSPPDCVLPVDVFTVSLEQGTYGYPGEDVAVVQVYAEQNYRFSEINIGHGGVLRVSPTMSYSGGGTALGPAIIEVTGDVNVDGKIWATGFSGASGEIGEGHHGGEGGWGYALAGKGGDGGEWKEENPYYEECMYSCVPDCINYNFGGIDCEYECDNVCQYNWDYNGQTGANGLGPYCGSGGRGGKEWEEGNIFGVFWNVGTLAFSIWNLDVVGALQSVYGIVDESVKIVNNDENEFKSAARGGSGPLSGPRFDLAEFTIPAAGGGGGGGGKKVKSTIIVPDKGGGGGGGGGGGAPGLKLVVNGNLYIGQEGKIFGIGGPGGRGGNGADGEGGPGGGGGGGNGAQILIIANKVINNNEIDVAGGMRGVPGAFLEDEKQMLVKQGFGGQGHNGVVRIDGRFFGNNPVNASPSYYHRGPVLGNLLEASVTSGDTLCKNVFLGKPRSLTTYYNYSNLHGIKYWYSGMVNSSVLPEENYYLWIIGDARVEICYPLNPGLNALSLKVNSEFDYGIEPEQGPFIELHPWQKQYVFYFPGIQDSDGDGLTDGLESNFGTDPYDTDSDDDGLTDGYEIYIHNTDPLNPDIDGDGLTDGDEINVYGTEPLNADTDGDGLTDGDEVNVHGTDPLNADTDDDLVQDDQDNCPNVANGDQADNESDGIGDLCDADDDNDGLTDYEETVFGTDPQNHNSDGDTVDDLNDAFPLDGNETVDSDPTETPITSDSANQVSPAISGHRIVWSDSRNGNNDIYMSEYDSLTDTWNETQITTNLGHQVWPVISGDRIVWQDQRYFRMIYMYDLSTKTETPMPMIGFPVQYYPDISGDRIVWQDQSNGNWDICMYDLSTGTETQITTNPEDQFRPAISGDRIVWQGRKNGNYDIYMYDLSTRTETRITTNPAIQTLPAISGNRIVWEDQRNGNNDIYMSEYDSLTDTWNETQITFDPGSQSYPAISGDRIIWWDFRNGNYDIYMSEYDSLTDTWNETQITTDPAMQRYAAISGDRIVWSDSRNDINNYGDIYMYKGDGVGDNTDNCPNDHNPMVPYNLGDSDGECATPSFGVGVGDLWQPDYDCDGAGDVCDADGDNDGLTDEDEINVYGTDPLNADTDGDGLTDGNEVNVHGTDPLNADTDGDLVQDDQDNCPNVANGDQADNESDGIGDLCDADDDNDGLTDEDEVNVHGTDPLNADTDGDGYRDNQEVVVGTDPLDSDSHLVYQESVPLVVDSPNPEAGAKFGSAVHILPDIDDDGKSDYLVGAPLKDVDGYTDVGQVYLFSSNGNLIWTFGHPYQQYRAGAQFGFSISHVGSDCQYILIGAPYESVDYEGPGGIATEGGAVYVFEPDGTFVKRITSPSPMPWGFFGLSIDAAKGVTAAEYQQIFGIAGVLVGEPYGGSWAATPGKAYLFNATEGFPLATDFTYPYSDDLSEFGYSVGIQYRVSNTGISDLCRIHIGVPGSSKDGPQGHGIVVTYEADSTLILDPSNGHGCNFAGVIPSYEGIAQEGAAYGSSVASVENATDLVAGAKGYDGVFDDQGGVYRPRGTDPLRAFDNPAPQAGARFGEQVTCFTFGYDTVFVAGAPGQDNDQGMVLLHVYSDYAFDMLRSPLPQNGALYGSALSGSADGTLAIGAPGEDVSGNSDQGRIYLYQMNDRDSDADDLYIGMERYLQTNPDDPDTDGDDLPDGYEVLQGLDPLVWNPPDW